MAEIKEPFNYPKNASEFDKRGTPLANTYVGEGGVLLSSGAVIYPNQKKQ